ncbi:DUF2975 domain-containing protein [Flavobacterium sp. CYK-4]|uniref:DUF2975 domain-containing protein n=1 Tax=Flavobacterium lotistagni TaxID=2709660 RepID=UPI00140A45A2|nr:DUF2975 domain-containing protein [Flavobacterium lotistagni]NHM07606.1 DUF2975 domain-containing protein [Flavobacterium lotistagni]
MKSVKLTSSFLYYLVSIIAYGYLITAIYTLINCTFEGPFFEKLPNNRFAINYPFTSEHFLLGSEFTTNYVAEMVLGIALYGIFFFVLSGVFNAFRQKKLFTLFGVNHLKRFYIFNLVLYPVLAILWAIISIEDFPFFAMISAHLIMGLFIYFMNAIFEQGLRLQNEQDLFI